MAKEVGHFLCFPDTGQDPDQVINNELRTRMLDADDVINIESDGDSSILVWYRFDTNKIADKIEAIKKIEAQCQEKPKPKGKET